MLRVLSAEQSREVETRAVEMQGSSLAALMRAAGAAIAHEATERVPHGTVVVACGRGNNGGDGWIAARDLLVLGREVRVVSVCDPAALEGIAADAARDAIAAGVSWGAPEPQSIPGEFGEADAIVDALLGRGSSLPLRDPLPVWCQSMNESSAYVICVDLPTGLDTDSGECAEEAVVADLTVTFTTLKPGLVTYPGAGWAGEIVVADIGIDPMLTDIPGAPEVWTRARYASLLPIPAPDAHKNDRGRLLVVAGSRRFIGAAVLAVRGAMRAGAGYVTLAVPEPMVSVAQAHLLAAPVVGLPAGRTGAFSSAAGAKALNLARDCDAVVLGPGLTLTDGAVATARTIVAGLDRPLVIDADGLNALVDARHLIDARKAPTLMTPHPGELARLLGTSSKNVRSDRVSSSTRLASAGTAVVLKGAGTVISGSERSVVNTSGTPALATAGTGDVLAGIVGAYLAQGLAPLEAGALGVYLHGRAGEIAASILTPVSVTAEDVPDHLPAAIGELLEDW